MPYVIHSGRRATASNLFFIQCTNAAFKQTVQKVTALAAGGGSATTLWSQANDANNLDVLSLACSSANNLVMDYENNSATIGDAFNYSTDGGSTFSNYNYNIANYGIATPGNFGQLFHMDLNTPSIIWAATQIGNGASPQVWHTSILYSTNSGQNWTEFNIETANAFPAGYTYYQSFPAPLHDGASAYCFFVLKNTSTNKYRLHLYKFKTDGTYTFYDDVGAIDTVINHTTTPNIDKGAISTNNTDVVYSYAWSSPTSRDIWSFTWSTKTWTQVKLNVSTNTFIRNFNSLPDGSTIIFSAGQANNTMHFFRSTDGWSTYTDTDLSSYSPGAGGNWYYVSRNAGGTLLTMLSDGSCLFSDDKGATWQHTAAIIDANGGGLTYDQSGTGGF